ncbi:MAG: thioredoxin domain-containing protein [Microscillaceae bacterium]|nr:thioredoxin domain-containing protein [Microscillaceae bacterium]
MQKIYLPLSQGLMFFLALTVACTARQDGKHPYTNALIHESSPYLLQHAHNPVNWYPWGETALHKAQTDKKLIIISVGYASCHWCHVMEKESFQDTAVANLMNTHFVSIKVDREERPDVDQIYMNACQLVNSNGCGWPLNIVALPDGRPVYAGTYLPQKQWVEVLQKLQNLYEKDPKKMSEFAENLTRGVQEMDLLPDSRANTEFGKNKLDTIFKNWKPQLDTEKGGRQGQNKFPSPSNYEYLLVHYYLSKDPEALKAVTLTLDNMAAGGIYDHIGGGFARYATDPDWVVPHFEKMLYDNAQLVSLYAKAYQLSQNPLYKEIVYQTLAFVERELSNPEGGFYSSYDADSEGEEGKFYVWSKAEIDQALGADAALFEEYYNISEEGNWEEGKNIIFRNTDHQDILERFSVTEETLAKKLEAARQKLYQIRNKRVKPPLDDKILTSWNALMLKAYADAYRVFGEEKFLKKAVANANFILSKLTDGDRLNRNYKGGKASINAFLDDYANLIDALIALYQATFDEQWLKKAQKITEYTLKHFDDPKTGMFFYTSDLDPKLITRRIDVPDNVIPSGNSVMAINLYRLGHYFYKETYIEKSRKMLSAVSKNVQQYGYFYSHWAILMSFFVSEPYEVAIVGDDFAAKRRALDKKYLPNILLMGGKTEGTLPLLENKLREGRTTIYVCKNKVCKLPVTEVEKAWDLIRVE